LSSSPFSIEHLAFVQVHIDIDVVFIIAVFLNILDVNVVSLVVVFAIPIDLPLGL
jgi:hypothetical protein